MQPPSDSAVTLLQDGIIKWCNHPVTQHYDCETCSLGNCPVAQQLKPLTVLNDLILLK